MPPKRQKKRRSPRSKAAAGRDTNGLRRAAARLFVWSLVLLVCVAAIGGIIWSLNHILFAANPHFTLRRIAVQGNQTLSEAVIRTRLLDLGAVPDHSNVLALPVSMFRQALESDPLIAEAQVVRKLPGTLSVTLVERIPVAAIRCATPCFLDKTGIILPWRDVSEERILPLITGVRSAHQLKPGMTVQDDALRGAVRLLRKLASRPDGVAYDIAVIQLDYYLPSLRLHLRPRGAFREGAIAIVPVIGMSEALDRLRDITRLRASKGNTIGYVDVTYQQNVPVRP